MSLTSRSQSPRNFVYASQLPNSQPHWIFGISGLSYRSLAHRDLSNSSLRTRTLSSLDRVTEDWCMLALKQLKGPLWLCSLDGSPRFPVPVDYPWLGIKKCRFLKSCLLSQETFSCLGTLFLSVFYGYISALPSPPWR